MPRTKPTLKLGVYGSFDINPEQAVSSYFESKLQNELYSLVKIILYILQFPYKKIIMYIFLKYSKKPCWDVPREGLQHEAIENEREYVEMSSQQDFFKKKSAIQRKVNEKRIDDMYQTQEKLREKFIAVNQFMKDCMEKSDRAENQISNEVKQQEMLKQEIEVIEHDLSVLSTFEAKFKEIVKEFQPYVDVFNEVIDASDEIQSFEDMMSRCDSLSMFIFLCHFYFKQKHLIDIIFSQSVGSSGNSRTRAGAD
jgi:Domain of unknown function (DUF4200)